MVIFRLREISSLFLFNLFFYSTEDDAICGILDKTTMQLSCIFQNINQSEIHTEVVTSWVPAVHKFLCFEKELVIWKCK